MIQGIDAVSAAYGADADSCVGAFYLAALTASRFDPRFRTFKERLIAAGKARKLVIVACARKLITVLNAITRAGTSYNEAAI